MADPGTCDRNPPSSGREAARTKERQLAHPEPGARVGKCRLERRPARLAGWGNPRVASRVWIATFRSHRTKTGPTANAGGTLGHRRFNRQGKAAANGAGAAMVQATHGCMAPTFGRERRASFQKSIESGEVTRSWRDSERSLVCREAMCPTSRHIQSGATRSSSHMCPTLP